MQFEKNVVEQFLWESYSIDSRKYLYKIINESDEDTCMNIAKNRILQDLFLLRRGKDPGFAFHVYSRINNNDRAFRNTVLYIQKLLLDGPYYNENQILSPDSSNQGLDKKKLAIDSDLKHNFHFSISFEDRGDGLFNFKTNNFADNYEHSKKESTKESLEYFNQRYEIALEDKDDLTAGAIHDLISEYKTHHYSLDYFSKKQHFYWNAATEKEKNFDLIRYVNENISNYGLYDANPANSELELTLHILSLGLEEKLIKILNNYDVGVIANSSEDKFSLQYFKFLTDAFSITSTIWFNSLSLNEKEKLLNGVYSFDQEKFTAYLSTLYKNKIDCSELKYLALSMYLNGFLDVAESIYVYLSDNAKDNLDNAGYLSQLGDIYREEIEYEKAYGMYRQLFDLSSKFPLKNRRNNLKNSGLYENPQYVSTISLLRMAEMECLLGEANAEIHLQEVKDRIDKTNKLEKISLMWNLACTYRRIGQFEHEYECLDDLASLGEGKRNDLVDKADNRIIQINEYFSRTLEKLDEKKLDEERLSDNTRLKSDPIQ